jgi:hypothetical protein
MINCNSTFAFRRTTLQAGRWRVRDYMRSMHYFDVPNHFSRTMALRFTEPLTEMSTRNLSGGEERQERPLRKADNLTDN